MSTLLAADTVRRIERGQLDDSLVLIGQAVVARLRVINEPDPVSPPCEADTMEDTHA